MRRTMSMQAEEPRGDSAERALQLMIQSLELLDSAGETRAAIHLDRAINVLGERLRQDDPA